MDLSRNLCFSPPPPLSSKLDLNAARNARSIHARVFDYFLLYFNFTLDLP